MQRILKYFLTLHSVCTFSSQAVCDLCSHQEVRATCFLGAKTQGEKSANHSLLLGKLNCWVFPLMTEGDSSEHFKETVPFNRKFSYSLGILKPVENPCLITV